VGYPSSYDLRGLGKVSAVGDQSTTPACWAFAAYGSLESYLLPTPWSFSENNMKNLAGFDVLNGCNGGGNQQMATAYLARWGGSMQSGPVTTTCDPFSLSCTDTSSCPVQQHVQNVLFLPYRASTNNDNIKWALQKYGGVYATMYIDTI